MKRAVLTVLALALALSLAWPAEQATVVRVVDGDTLVVEIGGSEERVRLIGVDTPETVHPQKPVEYFGKEASAFTTRMAEGAVVRLEADPQTADRDKYGRLLRYVYLPDGKLLNAEIIAQGYGFAYVKYPFSKMEEFRQLEREAREASRGLWSETATGAASEPSSLP
jgi:micrococcal nuclease